MVRSRCPRTRSVQPRLLSSWLGLGKQSPSGPLRAALARSHRGTHILKVHLMTAAVRIGADVPRVTISPARHRDSRFSTRSPCPGWCSRRSSPAWTTRTWRQPPSYRSRSPSDDHVEPQTSASDASVASSEFSGGGGPRLSSSQRSSLTTSSASWTRKRFHPANGVRPPRRYPSLSARPGRSTCSFKSPDGTGPSRPSLQVSSPAWCSASGST